MNKTTRFGAYIKNVRQFKNISLRSMANMLGIHFTYLSKIENGKTPPPSEEIIWHLTFILEDDFDDLLALAGKVDSKVIEFLTQFPDLTRGIRQTMSDLKKETQSG